jgi:YidC/Oxa1 family membrane protein insertase
MDRNSIFGIILIAGILIVWGVIQSPSKKELEAKRRAADSVAAVTRELKVADTATFTANVPAGTSGVLPADTGKLRSELGEFSVNATGKDAFYTLENSHIKLMVSAKGGRPYRVELKDYKTFTREPLILFDGDSTRFGLSFYNQNKLITTNDLYFTALDTTPKKIITAGADSLILRMGVSDDRFIEYTYTMEPESYMVNFSIRLVGMKDIVTRDPSAIDMNWEVYAPQHEQLKKNENQYTSVYFRYPNEDADFFKAGRSTKPVEKDIATQVQWIAFKNQFFSSVLISDNSFSNALLRMNTLNDSSKYLKNFTAEIGLPFKRIDNETINLKMFYGPNKYNLLKKYKGYKLEELVSVGKGIIRWINQFVIIPIFDWLSRFIGNYGLIILLLTIIIKIGLLPLTYRSYLSTARMKVLKPQIDELNQKYPKGKELEKQQATMALYKKAGVSPMGGCLPMLLQFPILFAMFKFFPTSIELRQEGFLWAKDLSTYDAILSWHQNLPLIGDHLSLFTILMTVSTIISMKLSDTTASSQQVPGMKTMMYIMPVMFLFALNNFSSGLTYYYFLANVITIGQNYLFKSFVDEKEILRKIEEKKAKPVKKSKFQQRLEEMAKQSGYRPTSNKPAKKK